MSELVSSPGRQRLMIVDDQPSNVRVMAEALRDEYELFFATSGTRALEIAAESRIELVLLDVVMPDLDGFEVCRRLKQKERTKKIPVIFVTALEEVSDETSGFDVGGVDYITKPIRPPIVRARVRTQLELKHARDLLETLASVDAGTGIPNRRQFDHSLEQEWKRAQRNGAPFSLALIDVDFFKRFNDRYGHARGDDCLRAVARALQTIARRPSDLAARYGGEEFALIMPETDGESMRAQMRRLLEGVRQLGIPHDGSTCYESVSVSAGAVTTIPHLEQTAWAVVETADRLLYEAKEGGRNQAWHLDSDTNSKERVL